MNIRQLLTFFLGIVAVVFMTVPLNAQEDLSAYILTPSPPLTPRINGAKVYGQRPGSPFMYKIPATGERPMRFSAKGLPKGLKLDEETGIISGKAKREGTYYVTLTAENSLGRAERELRIVIGEDLCLTPPLGWNSWNVWGDSVSEEKVLSSARSMVESGLADCGWSYINIDDGWQGLRGGKYNAIQPNSKFPDMKRLAQEIHSMGLKFGIYSGPWVATYAGHVGTSADHPDGTSDYMDKGVMDEYYKIDWSKLSSQEIKEIKYFGKYSFAEADARQWADWGVDYLKYDWNPNDVYNAVEMERALRKTGRDIVLSLSNTAPLAMAWHWKQHCQAWRTTNDINDTWESMSKIGFKLQERWAQFRAPGHWPDADMLVVGKVGWGPKVHDTRLTADEQYTHISLWAMLGSPMLIGCDMADMDPFTINLLCNTEVLDINQDPLGIQAFRYEGDDSYAVYVKPLEDNSVAVGLFNLSETSRIIGFKPFLLGIAGNQTIRDVWRQIDIANVSPGERWETEVAPHGVVLLRVYPGNNVADRLVGLHRLIK